MSVEDPFERVLARAVPDRIPTEIERIEAGNRKRTFRVSFAESPTLAVQYTSNDMERLVTEGALLREIVDRTDVPVPPVVASGALDGGSYLLTEWTEGTALCERFVALGSPDRQAVAHALGEHLAALHATFEFDAFGPLTTASMAPKTTAPTVAAAAPLAVAVPAPDWRTSFRDLVAEGLDAFRGPLTEFEPSIRAAIDSLERLPRAPVPRLFPWDFRPGNVLVRGENDNEIVAILDFESLRSAHREFSLAKAEYLLCDWYAVDSTRSASGDSGSNDPDAVEPAASTKGIDSEAIRAAFYAGYETRLPISEGYWRERRRIYRLGAIARAAFDSSGAVTRPGYPMVDPERAIRFHREHLRALL